MMTPMVMPPVMRTMMVMALAVVVDADVDVGRAQDFCRGRGTGLKSARLPLQQQLVGARTALNTGLEYLCSRTGIFHVSSQLHTEDVPERE
jgi:hypothetical protein